MLDRLTADRSRFDNNLQTGIGTSFTDLLLKKGLSNSLLKKIVWAALTNMFAPLARPLSKIRYNEGLASQPKCTKGSRRLNYAAQSVRIFQRLVYSQKGCLFLMVEETTNVKNSSWKRGFQMSHKSEYPFDIQGYSLKHLSFCVALE